MLTGLGYRFLTEGYGYPTAFTQAWSNMCTAGVQCTVCPATLSPVLQVKQTPVRPDHSHKYVAGFGKLDIPFVYSAATVGCFRSLA